MMWFILMGVLVIAGIVAAMMAGYQHDAIQFIGGLVAVIALIVLVVMGFTALSVPQGTRKFVVMYNSHITYLETIQGKKILSSERESEINSINRINQDIAMAKMTKGDSWYGPWVLNIQDLSPIDFNRVPEAIDTKVITVTK